MLYLPALKNGYVWDDIYFLVDTPNLRDPALWWDAVRQPLFVSVNYFRPLPLLSFVAENWLAGPSTGPSPFVSHLSNLILHAVNTTLVVMLTRRLQTNGGPWLAALAGLLFAIHPALAESVNWVSDRFDLMMTFCLLSALLVESRVAGRVPRTVATSALFFCALLCKETAVVFLVLLPVWQLARFHQETGALRGPQKFFDLGLGGIWFGVSVSLLAYLAFRFGSLGYFYQGDTPMSAGSAIQHALLIGKTIGWYLFLALWPFGQMGPVHPVRTPLPISDVWAWLGCAAVVVVIVLLAAAARRRPQSPQTLLFAMALLALAPVSNFLPLTIGDNLVHDRYLIMPLAFAAIGFVLALEPVATSWRVVAPVIIWCCASVMTVAAIIPHWQSNLSLWSWAYRNAPDSSIGRQNYLSALVTAGKNEDAAQLAREFLRDGTQNFNISHNLALAEARLGHFEVAEKVIQGFIEILDGDDPIERLGRSETLNLLAFIWMAQERYVEAEKPLRDAIALSPLFVRSRYNLALVLFELGDLEGGDSELAIAIRYSLPDDAATFARKGSEVRRQKVGAIGG